VTGVLAAAFAGPFSRLLAGGAGLGVAAGLCYAAGDVGTKAVVGGGTRLLFALPVMAAHGLGFVFKQLGFQRGGALATPGVATMFTNAVPIAAGMVLYGDALPFRRSRGRQAAFLRRCRGRRRLAHARAWPTG